MKKRSSYQASLAEETLSIEDPIVLQLLLGESDENLKQIAESVGVSIVRIAHNLTVRGAEAEVALALAVIKQLASVITAGEQIWPGDIERAIAILSRDRRAQLSDLFRDQIRISGRTHTIVPKTFAQKQYIETIRSHDVVFAIGPAGTGKTYLAMAMAVSALLKKEVKRIVLCRPAVEAGERLGFLPGDMAEKVNPYLRPLYDALHDMVDPDRARELVEKGNIEVAPLAFMRGRTLSNAFVILDEAQNTTIGQMKMLLTRLGRNSKYVITGDVTQVDLPRGELSGLIHAEKTLSDVAGIGFSKMSDLDVVRHPLVAKIIKAYAETYEKTNRLTAAGLDR